MPVKKLHLYPYAEIAYKLRFMLPIQNVLNDYLKL